MSAKTWQYTVQGTAIDGQSWTAEGTVICEFGDTFRFAMRQCFDLLIDSRTVDGQVGCAGPLNVQRVLIVQRS